MKRNKVFIGQEVFLHVFCSETYEVKGKICSIDSYSFTVALENGEEFVTFHFGSNRDDSGSFEIVSV
jgi:hypothetical protein